MEFNQDNIVQDNKIKITETQKGILLFILGYIKDSLSLPFIIFQIWLMIIILFMIMIIFLLWFQPTLDFIKPILSLLKIEEININISDKPINTSTLIMIYFVVTLVFSLVVRLINRLFNIRLGLTLVKKFVLAVTFILIGYSFFIIIFPLIDNTEQIGWLFYVIIPIIGLLHIMTAITWFGACWAYEKIERWINENKIDKWVTDLKASINKLQIKNNQVEGRFR